jgi:hypothetical protein
MNHKISDGLGYTSVQIWNAFGKVASTDTPGMGLCYVIIKEYLKKD